MKKSIMVLAGVCMTAILASGCGSKSASADGPFVPKDTVNWTVTSSPGGGSDIFSRMIADIMATEKLVEPAVVITNKTDGGGEIGRNETAGMKGKKADYTLLTFNSGDLMPMVQNTKNRVEDFRILAIMAVDKQLVFKGKATKYADFKEAVEAAKAGTKVIIGGSKGDDIATYEALLEEIGVDKNSMTYITFNSTGDAITAALGSHVEFVISKPAAATEYVEAGSLIPVLALSTERFTGKLAEAPTLSEIGDYKDVEVPVWRGVAAPKEMSDAAVKFWSETLKTVSETEKWNKDYLEKNKLIANYMDAEAATAYVQKYEADYLETLEK